LIYKTLVHRDVSVSALFATFVFVTGILSAIVYVKLQRKHLQDDALVLFGLTLYMIAELFMPVYRHQYNTVQWLPLILLAVSICLRLLSVEIVLVFSGILLNISNSSMIPLRHTVGEYLILAGLLFLAFHQQVLKGKRGVLLMCRRIKLRSQTETRLFVII